MEPPIHPACFRRRAKFNFRCSAGWEGGKGLRQQGVQSSYLLLKPPRNRADISGGNG